MEKKIFPAKLDNLRAMLEAINKTAEALGFDSRKMNQIEVAAEEVLANIINYAYPDKEGNIEITLNPKPGEGLEIEIADWGFPFDPLKLPAPDVCAPLEQRRIGGLGVHLLRKFTDGVHYKRDNDRNVLFFVKKL